MQDVVTETARAKINLALHVTGRREDGYHLLDSVVTFADHGDILTIRAATEDRFEISGRFGGLLASDADNLVLRARDLLRGVLQARGHACPPVAISLHKELPVAAGIGGGSADAAACLRGLLRHWHAELPIRELHTLGLTLGADVPMCLDSRPLTARGIGETITAIALPAFSMVLVNPLVGVSTPDIFRRLQRRDNPPLAPLPRSADPGAWTDYLSRQRNDLEPPARSLVPQIGDLCLALDEAGAKVSRMSGSGATCFGLFVDDDQASAAAVHLARRFPASYIQPTRTLPSRILEGTPA